MDDAQAQAVGWRGGDVRQRSLTTFSTGRLGGFPQASWLYWTESAWLLYAHECRRFNPLSDNAQPRVSVRLTAEQAAFLASQTVGFHKISDVVRDLVDQAMAKTRETLDSPGTLGARPQGGLPSNSTSTIVIPTLSNSDIHSKIEISKKRKLPSKESTTEPLENPGTGTRPSRSYDIEFEIWWRQYQAIKNRASNQSKPKAWEQWRKACKLVTVMDLRDCLTAAVREQQMIERQGGFASPFPDAFRWLRDGRWEAFMPSDTQQTLEAPSRALQGPLPSDPF